MDAVSKGPPDTADRTMLAPLRYLAFRRIWLASFASNFGQLIQGVGAAWAMTLLSRSADMVAMVQTAAFLPMMLLSLVSGAVADMFDRRIVGMLAIVTAFLSAAALSVCAYLGVLTPFSLLALSFAIGTGMAMFAPTWQASVSEQVPSNIMPQAISLNSISFNVARSFAPALGGAMVAAFGALSAFIANTVLYLPMLFALATWKREKTIPRLPPESLGRAIISGVRYVLHSPPIRVVMVRTLLLAVGGGAVSALMPLIARDLVGGGALTFGLLLGAFGIGAVAGALNLSTLRHRYSNERIATVCMIAAGLATIVVGLSHTLTLSLPALVIMGGAWMLTVASLNIEVQLAAPRWVAGRALAAFQAAIAGGIAIAGIVWGHAAEAYGVSAAVCVSGATMLLLPLLALWLKLPHASGGVEDARETLADPHVVLRLTPRSGPIVIEIDYRIDPERARDFYEALEQGVRRARQRNGAYGWSISRDVADPSLWTERYHTPTWHDYLRLRDRGTQAERELEALLEPFFTGPRVVRRLLERPFGSVRWRAESPDRGEGQTPMPGPQI